MYEQRRNAFDIIIIEQSLYPYSPILSATRKREPLCVGNTVAEATTTTVGNPSTVVDGPQGTIGGGGSGGVGGETATGMVSNCSMPDFSVHATTTIPSSLSGSPFLELNKADSLFRQPQGGGLTSNTMIRKDISRTRQPLCGADLIRSILRLEQQQHQDEETMASTTAVSSSSFVSSTTSVQTSTSSSQP